MDKKTVLISGATSGIGKATALAMCQRDYRVIILGRNELKLADTTRWLSEQCPSSEVFGYLVDFSDLMSVNAVVETLSVEHPVIDIVINNAGALHMTQVETPEGLEKTLVVNYYSHFVLTMGLLNNIKISANGRIINVSSDCYKLPSYDMNEQIEPEKYNWNKAYNRSKLAQVQFTHRLQQELLDSGVTVTCVSPGGVKTNIYDPMPKVLRWLTSFSLKPVEKGIRDIVHIATQPDIQNYRGAFVSGGKVKAVPARCLNEEQINFLWQRSLEACAV